MILDFIKISNLIDKILKTAFKFDHLTLADLTIRSISDSSLMAPSTFKTGLRNKTKAFDLIIYLSLNQDEQLKVQIQSHDGLLTDEEYKKSISNFKFFILYLILRGSLPVLSQPIPKILDIINGTELRITEILESISDFPLNKLDLRFIQLVKLDQLPKTLLSRLKLGFPGHRYLNVIRYNAPTTTNDSLLSIRKALLDFTEKRYYWDIFPLTRSDSFELMFPSFNKNLYNLMLKLYSTEQINQFFESKLIPIISNYDSRFENFYTWNFDCKLKYPIFDTDI